MKKSSKKYSKGYSMSHNRNKLITLLIGNLTNAVVHQVLEKSVREEILRKHYDKESLHSLEIAKRYREQINPIQRALPDTNVETIKEEILKRSRKELLLRISKGYQGIELEALESIVEKLLEELKIK